MNLFLFFLGIVVLASVNNLADEKENRNKAVHAIVILVTLVIMWSLIR
jgi:hypothetical protein